MRKLTLYVENRESYSWSLKEFMSSQAMLELHCDLALEGIVSDASWWLARYHENPDGYWDTIDQGCISSPFLSMNDALLNLRQKLTEKQVAIAEKRAKGSFVIHLNQEGER